MLVHRGVLFAFLRTGGTHGDAGFELCSQHAQLRPRLAREDGRRHTADVGAVEVEANASTEMVNAVLSETG